MVYFDTFEDLKKHFQLINPPVKTLLVKKEGDYSIYDYRNHSERLTTVNPETFQYRENKEHFRGLNTLDDIDESMWLCGGCSITYGIGVPEESRWSNLSFGDNHVNVGVPGSSVSKIVRHMSAILDFKKPKGVVVLLPNPERIDFPQTTLDGKYSENGFTPGILTSNHRNSDQDRADKETYEALIRYLSPEYFDMNIMMNIELLISKCSMLGVELIMSSWNPIMRKLLSSQQHRKFKYFDMDKFESFARGRDASHPGKEFHLHVVNKINNLLNKLDPI